MRALEAIVQAPVRQDVELFRHILDALPYPIFWKGRDLRYLGCNVAFARISGRVHPDAVVGLSDYELPWRKEDSDFYRACDQQVMESAQTLAECEEPVRGSEGVRRWTQTSKVPLRDDRGFVFGVLGLLVDVTQQRETQAHLQVALTAGEAANRMLKAQVAERELMQRALALSEMRLRTAVRGTQMTLFGLDAAGVFTFSDGGALSTLGHEPGWLVGHSIFDVFPDHPEILAQTRRALAGESFTGYISFDRIHYETRYAPIFDEAGTLTGVTGLAVDVSERVRYQEVLEAELERTRNQLLQ
ncbi:MAG TPA: PAS domain-containing protein, partial [Archangium sp.]|nr:PAS domain-containing protein [Archangium sp.]